MDGLVGLQMEVAYECVAYFSRPGELLLRSMGMTVGLQLLRLVQRALLCLSQSLHGEVPRHLRVVGCCLRVAPLDCFLGVAECFLGLSCQFSVAAVTTAGIRAYEGSSANNEQNLHGTVTTEAKEAV